MKWKVLSLYEDEFDLVEHLEKLAEDLTVLIAKADDPAGVGSAENDPAVVLAALKTARDAVEFTASWLVEHV